MTIGFERGAVYVPRYSRDGRSVPSPDEDPFTMAVTAIEGLAVGGPAPRVSSVQLVGEFPPTVGWALPAYAGGRLELAMHAGDGRGLAAALQAAAGVRSDRAAWVVAVEPTGARGALAVALRFGPNAAAQVPSWDLSTGPDGAASLARAALAEVDAVAGGTPGAPSLPPPWDPDRAGRFTSLPPSHLSEGAYVPRPRYLENLSSRWRLEGDRCGQCGQLTFPRRGRCRSCGRSDRLSVAPLPRDGARVVAVTAIGKGGQPTEFDPQVDALGGYGVVLAEFEPGVRLTLQVTDAAPGEVRIGDRVATRLRRLYPMEGEWRYGRKAVPWAP